MVEAHLRVKHALLLDFQRVSLTMETTIISETSENFYQTTHFSIPDYVSVHVQRLDLELSLQKYVV
jgi:hypothetical protein